MIADMFEWWLRYFDGSSVGLDCLDAFGLSVRSGSRIYREAATKSSLTPTSRSNTWRSDRSGPFPGGGSMWRGRAGFGIGGGVAQAKAGRGEAAEPAVAIDQTDVAVAEAHHMIAGFAFVKADRFADQRFADKHALALPHDLARTAHAADLVFGIVPGILDALRHRPRRWRVDLLRRPLAECFVRTLFIVVSPEDIETGLLLARIGCRRTRSLCLEGAMHALVAAILLRRRRMDEMRLDAELDPPCRQ